MAVEKFLGQKLAKHPSAVVKIPALTTWALILPALESCVSLAK